MQENEPKRNKAATTAMVVSVLSRFLFPMTEDVSAVTRRRYREKMERIAQATLRAFHKEFENELGKAPKGRADTRHLPSNRSPRKALRHARDVRRSGSNRV